MPTDSARTGQPHRHQSHRHQGLDGCAGHFRATREANRRQLLVALGLLTAFGIGEVVVAALVGSVALFADAGHMVTDIGALLGALWAARLAVRPAGGTWTFGYARAEILAAALNGVTLLLVAGAVGVEAVRRLFDPPEVPGLALVIVAAVGGLVNFAATLVLSRADRGSLNVEGAFQHLLTDAYAFGATFLAGVVLLTTNFRRADPLASLVVVVLLVRAAVSLLRASGRVLLEGAPKGVELADVRQHLLSTPQVLDVHDLHVWELTSDLPAISAHLVVADDCFTRGHVPSLLDQVQHCLRGHFDVEHSTFQFEPASHAAHEPGSHN